MTIRTIAWTGMTLLALTVAGYAFAVLLVPGFSPGIVSHLLRDHPLAAPAHFAGGGVALAAGAFQVNAWLRRRYIHVHRWCGRAYVISVLVGGAGALALAVHSSGGMVARLGFGLLAVFWLATTFNAYRKIRQRNVAAHRDWISRSYALTLAAVTLRLYLPASMIAAAPMAVAYPAIAWLCWVPNLLVAEWMIRSRRRTITPAMSEPPPDPA